MSGWRIRDYHADDVDGILRLWEQMLAVNAEPVYGLSDVLASCEKDHAVVAVMATRWSVRPIGRAAHAQGWVVFLATAAHVPRVAGSVRRCSPRSRPGWRRTGIKLSALMPEAETRVEAFLHQGFALKKNLRYFERNIPVQRQELKTLACWAAASCRAGCGTTSPACRREGTARTTRGPAARPGRPRRRIRRGAAARDRAVRAARNRQDHLREGDRVTAGVAVRGGLPLPAGRRPGRSGRGAARDVPRRSPNSSTRSCSSTRSRRSPRSARANRRRRPQGVTNELLKIIPAFREQPGRLLVCATNFIRALDSAFLRHGRFDYVIPIGLPDGQARRAMWQRYIPAAVVECDVDVLVELTEGFSPADIEYAARKASQSALENAVNSGAENPEGPFLDDYVAAISATRATVSADVAAEFWEDIETVGRL